MILFGRVNYITCLFECLLDLFDKVVKPILVYGSEVWGFGDNRVIKRAHLKFCKTILNF